MIIGISGKKQSGKSTIANKLHEIIPNSRIVCFADELKKIVLNSFVPIDWFWELKDLELEENKQKITPCGKTVRELLQIVGTDWFRSVYPDVWVNAYWNTVGKLPKNTTIITPDIRFENELKFIQAHDGIVIRTLRHPFEDNHPSETALDEVQEYALDIEDDTSGFSIWHNCGSGEYLISDVPEYRHGKQFDVVLDNTEMSMEDLYKWCEFIVNELQVSKM